VSNSSKNSKDLLNKNLIAIGTASNIATRILNITVLVWLNQYLLKQIGPDEYSLYPVTVSLMAFGPILTTLLNSGLGRYAVSAYAKDDEEEVTRLVSTMFAPLVGIALLVTVLGFVIAGNLERILTIQADKLSDARWMVSFMFVTLAIRFPLAPFSTGMSMRQRYDLDNLVFVACEFLRIGLLLSLIRLFGAKVLWVVVAMSAADWVRLLLRNAVSRRLVPCLRFDRHMIKWSRAKEILSFGSWAVLGKTVDTIRTSADPLILNRWANNFEVSCFHLGSVVASQITSAANMILSPLQDALIAMDALDDDERIRETYIKSGRYALWAAMLIAVPLMVFHREVITLYVGETYQKAGTVMMIMMFLLPVGYAGISLYNIAYAKARINQTSLTDTLIQVANLALTLYLVRTLHWGAIGSASATLVTNGLGGMLLFWPLGLKLSHTPARRWFRETLRPGLTPAICTVLLLLLCRSYWIPDTWIELFLVCAIGGLAYVTALALCMSGVERRALVAWCSRMRAKLHRAGSLSR
jgi:O-antigen/teichoic acid export membrane protein